MVKKRYSQRPKHDDRMPLEEVPPITSQCFEALKPLDRVVREMEAKWGIEVLPSLVSPKMAARFEMARRHVDDAVRSNDPEAVAKKVAALMRGWLILDTEAEKAGNRPDEDKVWHVEADGWPIAICRTEKDLKGAAEGHRVFTLDEVARLLQAHYRGVLEAKKHFPASKVESVAVDSDFDWSKGDEIPF